MRVVLDGRRVVVTRRSVRVFVVRRVVAGRLDEVLVRGLVDRGREVEVDVLRVPDRVLVTRRPVLADDEERLLLELRRTDCARAAPELDELPEDAEGR